MYQFQPFHTNRVKLDIPYFVFLIVPLFFSSFTGSGTRTAASVHKWPRNASTYQKTPSPPLPACRWNSQCFPSPGDKSCHTAFTSFCAAHFQHVDYQHHVASLILERVSAVCPDQHWHWTMAPRPKPSRPRKIADSFLLVDRTAEQRSQTSVPSNPASVWQEAEKDSAKAVFRCPSTSLRCLGQVPERRNIGKPPPEDSFTCHRFASSLSSNITLSQEYRILYDVFLS